MLKRMRKKGLAHVFLRMDYGELGQGNDLGFIFNLCVGNLGG